MPSGSDARFYWLNAERFAPFLNFPHQVPITLWNELQLNWEPTRLLEEQPGEKYTFWAQGPLSDDEQDLLCDLGEGLLALALRVAGQGEWRADVSGCLGYLFNNGLPVAEPLPEHLEAPWAQFRQIFDRQSHSLPPWLDQVYNSGGFYAGLLPVEAVTQLQSASLATGLLDWLAAQLNQAGPAWASSGKDLLELKAFLAARPAEPVWLLASEPFG